MTVGSIYIPGEGFSMGRLDEVAYVYLPGEVERDSASVFKDLVLESLAIDGVKKVIVDLRETNLIDSTFLGITLGCVKRARAANKALVLGGPLDSEVADVLEKSHSDRFIELEDLNAQESQSP
jgi:anti-anti-sigma factor